MPTHAEATRLNLEYYRKQAKNLLKAVKAGDREAAEQMSRFVPRLAAGDFTGVALHDAQLAIAREQGFASWPRFKTFLERSKLDFQGLVNTFVEAAVSDGPRAAEILKEHPELAQAGIYTALVLGDVERVEQALRVDAAFVRTTGGPLEWQPLLYVCFSRFAYGGGPQAERFGAAARVLLSAGADPNASYTPEQWPDNPLSCLYGAAGLNNNRALALALLDAGANPNDGESLYHSTEHADLACFRLLLERGASPKGSNALKHMLDREELEGVKLLLAAGADPNETNERGETALHWGVWRGRSARIIETLLDAGAELDTTRHDGRTAYVLALQGGQEVAALLAARGANTELSVVDQFIADCERAEPEGLERLMARAPRIELPALSGHLITDLVQSHSTAAVRGLLAAGVPVNTCGEHGATALHWACWKGYGDLAKILLDHGASLTAEDTTFHGTPPGWFGHGVQNCGDPGGDYAEVARVLIAAGAKIPAVDVPTGRPEVDAVLREHGLIE